MLEFFRKYQRAFFIFITAVVIASFSFFGTFTTFQPTEKKEDRVVAQAINGSPILLFQVRQMAHFLATDREDLPQRGAPSNLLNDGVVRYDFLRAGLADVLVAAYFEECKSAIQTRLERAKRFRPYVHPGLPGLSAKAVWDRYLPLLSQEVAALQKESEAAPEVFSRLSRIYQQQSFLHPELLRRILMSQHQQYAWAGLDPRLAQEDLALFGFHTLADWFGDDFLNLVSQFILNAAIAAEEKGYRVTLEEARGDLIHHYEASVVKLAAANVQIESNYHQHLRSLGFDEAGAAEIWQKVLLFRRYFQDVGQTAFLDRLPYQDFASFAMQAANVEKYEWPASLRFKTYRDVAEFQTYLNAVCKPEKNLSILPKEFLSIEEVERQFPELVQTEYKAQAASLTKSQIGLRASLKEIWEWETNEQNWDLLRKEFSFLPAASSNKERFETLEKLDVASRSQIDAFSRSRLVDQHPEWIAQSLAQTRREEKRLAVFGSDKAPSIRFQTVENGPKLAALIIQAAAREGNAAAELQTYVDEDRFFCFEQVEKVSDKRILTFQEARGILSALTNKSLEEQYLKIRAKHTSKFQNSEGQWKPFSEVGEEVAALVHTDLFRSLEQEGKAESADVKNIPAFRLLASSHQALEALKRDPADPLWVKTEGNPLEQQFKLERKECLLQRTSKEKWMKEEDFLMVPNDWSPVRLSDEGQIVFFYMQEKKGPEAPILDLLAFGKETLAADAQRFLAERLIEYSKKKQAIVIPLQTEEMVGDQNEPL